MPELRMGGLYYDLTLRNSMKPGLQDASNDLKGLEREGQRTSLSLKSLAKDTSILGGSLAALGGTALVAGTVLGGEFGEGLQVAGAGLAIVGSTIATLVPAMKGLSVVIDGTIIPALIRLNAFLGPAGWIVIGIGAAAAAIGTFMYMQDQAKKSMDDYGTSAGIASSNVGALKDALTEVQRIQEEMAGIPATVEELSHRKAGLMNQRSRAFERLAQAKATGTPQDVSEALWDIEGIDIEYGKVSSKLNATLAQYRGGPARLQSAQNVAGALATPSGTFQFTDLGSMTPTFSPGAAMGGTRMTTPIQINIIGTVKDETFNINADTMGDKAKQTGAIW